MKYKSATSLMLSAFLLASCAATPTDTPAPQQAPASQASGDPNFAAKCEQRIRAGLTNPAAAEIDLSGEGDELQADVTAMNPDNGEKTYLRYVCIRDEERAITARLIAD